MDAFLCCGCAHCCMNLREGANAETFAEPHPGTYRMPSRGGIKVLSTELRDERDSGRIRAVPHLVTVVGDEVWVLVWEIDHDSCPLLDEGRCSVYDHRPGVCQAFPILGTRAGLVASNTCHAANLLDNVPGKVMVMYPNETNAAEVTLTAMRKLADAVADTLRAASKEPLRDLLEVDIRAIPLVEASDRVNAP